ncbi:MAG: polyphosphate polymerase domain-containing protein [Staphylococcus equorum]|nr:polyphosphate polymerase domain-containing protein [Staphylococcus equorum]
MYRSEQKYLVNENTLQIMHQKLAPMLEYDEHQKGSSYRIRSMYFDTYSRKSYRENDAGVEERKKYRIRVYDDPKEIIRLEIKNKLKERNYKENCILTIEQYQDIMNETLRYDSSFPKALNMIYLDMKMNLLRPSVIVEYERTAFTYTTGNIRITFDKNIAYSYEFDQFLEMNIPKIPLLPKNKHVFEVKFDEVLPEFIAQTIATGELQRTTFSKFYYSHLKTEGEGSEW